MSETKTPWTPGPWEVTSRFVGPLVIVGRCPVEIDRSGKIDIAHVGAEVFATAMANAELIAAAPSLYEALERLRSQIIGWGDDSQIEAISDDLVAASRALALAKGETK